MLLLQYNHTTIAQNKIAPKPTGNDAQKRVLTDRKSIFDPLRNRNKSGACICRLTPLQVFIIIWFFFVFLGFNLNSNRKKANFCYALRMVQGQIRRRITVARLWFGIEVSRSETAGRKCIRLFDDQMAVVASLCADARAILVPLSSHCYLGGIFRLDRQIRPRGGQSPAFDIAY